MATEREILSGDQNNPILMGIGIVLALAVIAIAMKHFGII